MRRYWPTSLTNGGGRWCAGFSLVEMLVALLVFAIALGGASLVLRPDPSRLLAAEAERLALLLAQAKEESELSGSSLAWVAGELQYEFARRELTESGPQWRSLGDDALFRLHKLPQGMRLRVIEADGRILALGEPLDLGLLGPQAVRIRLAIGDLQAEINGSGNYFSSLVLQEKT